MDWSLIDTAEKDKRHTLFLKNIEFMRKFYHFNIFLLKLLRFRAPEHDLIQNDLLSNTKDFNIFLNITEILRRLKLCTKQSFSLPILCYFFKLKIISRHGNNARKNTYELEKRANHDNLLKTI